MNEELIKHWDIYLIILLYCISCILCIWFGYNQCRKKLKKKHLRDDKK
jgi:hypothetical protein